MENSSNLHELITLSNQSIISIDIKCFSAGLYTGKMWICIYFYHASRLLQNDEYRIFAEKLLVDIYSTTKHSTVIDFDKGTSGIDWRLHYLIKNRFVTGNPNYILQEIDNVVYQAFHFDWLTDKGKYRIVFLRLLFYYSERSQTIKNPTEKTLVQKTIIWIINHIEDYYANIPWHVPQSFNIEKYEIVLYLYLLNRIYQYEFYNYKIVKIWEDLSSIILSTIPILHTNRLLLALVIQKVLECVDLPEWKLHKQLLDEHIDHDQKALEEFFNKNVTLRCSIYGYCLLLFMQGKPLSPSIAYHILRKLENSSILTERFSPMSIMNFGNLGLFDSYAGVALMYQLLKMSEL